MSENNSAVKATKTIHDMTMGSPAKLIVQFMIPMFLEIFSSSFIMWQIRSLPDNSLVYVHWQRLAVRDL